MDDKTFQGSVQKKPAAALQMVLGSNRDRMKKREFDRIFDELPEESRAHYESERAFLIRYVHNRHNSQLELCFGVRFRMLHSSILEHAHTHTHTHAHVARCMQMSP